CCCGTISCWSNGAPATADMENCASAWNNRFLGGGALTVRTRMIDEVVNATDSKRAETVASITDGNRLSSAGSIIHAANRRPVLCVCWHAMQSIFHPLEAAVFVCVVSCVPRWGILVALAYCE